MGISVQTKFKIEGYRIIFPSSWFEHDTARIFIFVHQELNVKIRQPNQSEHKLANYLTRPKTHLIDLYYREWTNCVTGGNDMASQLSDLLMLTDICGAGELLRT